MRILILGDSMGLPRFHRERDEVECYYDDTYPEHLRRLAQQEWPGEETQVLNRCVHAATSLSLKKGAASEIIFFRPDFVVLQLGLADLWPREGHAGAPDAGNADAARDPWVDAETFEAAMEHFLGFCSTVEGLRVVLVNAPRVSDGQYQRHPGALERTKQYNEVLRRLAMRNRANLVDAFQLFLDLGPAACGSDGIHPTASAAHKLAERILHEIRHCRRARQFEPGLEAAQP